VVGFLLVLGLQLLTAALSLSIMKKTYPVSGKARSTTGYCQHLRADGKRRANRATRRAHCEAAADARNFRISDC
jgi:hypothetical protein